MKILLRTLAGTLLGLIGAFFLIVMVELFSGAVHPFPADFKGTSEEICRHVERYPSWVLALVVPMWVITAFAGVWVAGRVGGAYASVAVGLLLLVALAWNAFMLPYPMWFKVACLSAIPVAIVGGRGLSSPNSTTASKRTTMHSSSTPAKPPP